MPFILAAIDNPIIYAFRESDAFARLIVVVLFLLSAYAWCIMVEKAWVLFMTYRSMNRFLEDFNEENNVLRMAARLKKYSGPVVDIFRAGLEELIEVLNLGKPSVENMLREQRLPRVLTPAEIEKVRVTMDRTVDQKSTELEERLGLLGTIVSISPFLGLLGTVWGVMLSFIGMAKLGRPDIGAIAPGISGALLTTVVGLVVAIPSLAGNNAISNTVIKRCVDLENFVDSFVTLLKLTNRESED